MASCHPEALVALRIRLATRQPVGQSFQQALEVLPSDPKLRNPNILIVHKPGLALVWKSQPAAVSLFFALQQPSGQTSSRKCGNPCVLDGLQAQGSRQKRRVLGIPLLGLKCFSGTCQIQHFLPESYYSETFLTDCIESLNSFSLKKKKS